MTEIISSTELKVLKLVMLMSALLLALDVLFFAL